MPPRLAQPRLWRGLTLAGAAALGAAGPLAADAPAHETPAHETPAHETPAHETPVHETPVHETPVHETPVHETMGARLWLAQAGEGGEGGEAGAVAEVSPDVAYLAQLAIVEGHLAAAAELYRKGLTDDAIELASHPEAEMMEVVRAAVAAHGAADVTPAMRAFSETMRRGAAPEAVERALAEASAAFAAAAAPEQAEIRARFGALLALVRAAHGEYSDSVADGRVTDAMAFHEAHGFILVARALARALAAEPDATTAATAAKALDALAGADAAFGDVMAADPAAGDPGILLAVASRIELAMSSPR